MDKKPTDEKDSTFHSEINNMFESYLHMDDIPKILVKDVAKDRVLENIDYTKVFFDTDLNMYKLENGMFQRVDNPNFKPVVVKK